MQQEDIDKQIKMFLQGGGKITHIPYGVRKDDFAAADPNRFRKYTINTTEHKEGKDVQV